MAKVVIKTCLDCGHTQRLPEHKMDCISCEQMSLAYFRDIDHLVKYIDLYGLRKLNIVDTDITVAVLKAFS